MLKENDVPLETKLYYIDTNLGARRNKYSNSRKCLWKYGSKMRYYDIDSRDYKELLDTLALDRFSNTEISTLKFFNDFPELMNKYDIRDQYELHNLLKKYVIRKITVISALKSNHLSISVRLILIKSLICLSECCHRFRRKN